MADLNEAQAAQTIKIVGSDITGTETNYLSVDNTGAVLTELKPVNYDAFGRVRVSNPETHFECSFPLDKYPQVFDESVANSGSVVHSPALSSVILTTTAAANSSAAFASRIAFKYHPGKSNLLLLTGSFVETKANTKKYFGQYDANNGYFFLLDGTVLKAVIRSSTSGSVVDTEIAQSSWNTDKLDGTGLSGLTLDLTKQQIMFIDYQWLGSGAVRFGFVVNGNIVVCHQFNNSNILSVPYSSTANLPIRAECVSTAINSNTTLRLTCVALMSEGGTYPDFGSLIGVNNGATPINFSGAGTTLPLLSVRLQSTVRNVHINPLEFSAFGNSVDDFLVEIRKNATLTGGTWTAVGKISEFNRTATAVTGGTVLYSTYVRGNTTNQAILSDILESTFDSTLGYSIAGTADIITIVATNLTANATLSSTLTCREVV